MSIEYTLLNIGSGKVHGKDRQLVMNPYSKEVAAELCIASADNVGAVISAAAIAAALTANEGTLILEKPGQTQSTEKIK